MAPRVRAKLGARTGALLAFAGLAALVVPVVLVIACTPPPVEVITPAPSPEPEPAPACAPPPAEALAYLSDTTCPWVLVQGDTAEMSLRRTDLTPPPALNVAPPEECAGRCRFSGAVTPLGPLLLAVRADPNSELADAAFIGVALGGRTLRFAPLWFGRPVLGDGTPQGPAYALAPWLCGDMLVLRPGPRLPGATSEEPSTALQAAAGVYEIAEDELRRADRAAPEDITQCLPVPLELP
jgi:hypothetical protein